MADYSNWDCDECGSFQGHKAWCSHNYQNHGKAKMTPAEWWEAKLEECVNPTPYRDVVECSYCVSLVLKASWPKHPKLHIKV